MTIENILSSLIATAIWAILFAVGGWVVRETKSERKNAKKIIELVDRIAASGDETPRVVSGVDTLVGALRSRLNRRAIFWLILSLAALIAGLYLLACTK